MSRLLLAALAAILAGAALTQGPAPRAQAQDEEPELGNMFLVSTSVCLALNAAGPVACVQGISHVANFGLENRREAFRELLNDNLNDPLTREEVNAYASFGGNHLHSRDGHLPVIIFVDDDNPLQISTEKGALRWGPNGENVTQSYDCSLAPVAGNESNIAADEDCDGDGTVGDGIVWAFLIGNGDTDFGVGRILALDLDEFDEQSTAVTLVGEPDAVRAAAFETSIGAGLDPEECDLPSGAAGFLDALNHPQKTVVIARAADENGDDVTGAWFQFALDSENDDKVVVAAPQTPTLNLGTFGIGAPNVLCGIEPTETATLTVTLLAGPQNLSIDPFAELGEDFSFEVIVTGEANAIALTATPASIPCDGVATSEVAATVTDSEGNNVANGTRVHFDVQVLGTANPINANTGDGVAKSTIQPLAISDTGVPVTVSTVKGDGSLVANQILVSCSGAGAPPPPPGGGPAPGGPGAPTGPGGRPGGVITGPDTGSGGLGADSGLPWWPLLPLVAGFALLAGGRALISRRVR
jgi:hypothetical protein